VVKLRTHETLWNYKLDSYPRLSESLQLKY